MSEATIQKPIDEKDKITFLMQEYNSLRQEILNRTTHGFQTVALAATFFVLILNLQAGWKLWVSIGAAAIVVIVAARETFKRIWIAARRVRMIERDVNRRLGEEVLVWEQHYSPLAEHSGTSQPIPD